MKVSMHQKLFAIVLPTAVVVIVSLVAGIFAANDLRNELRTLHGRLAYTLKAERLVRLVDAEVKQQQDATTTDHNEAAVSNVHALRDQANALLAQWGRELSALPPGDAEQRGADLDRIRGAYDEFARAGDHAIGLAAAGRRHEASTVVENELGQDAPASVRAGLTRFVESEEARVNDHFRQVQSRIRIVLVWAAILMALMLATSFITPWLMSRWLMRPVAELGDAVDRVAEGDLAARVEPGGEDEMGRLCTRFNTMTERLGVSHHNMMRALHELSDAREHALATSRTRTEFLANLSHEIRTSLHGVLGMTDLALETGLTATQREQVSNARASAEGVLGIIEDVVDFSKIEAGQLELERKPFDPRTTLNQIAESLTRRAHEKGLELMCEVSNEVPDDVVGDEGRVRQVLVKLVDNAVKFTESGEIVVAVGLEESTADHVRLTFRVTDTGIGIAPERQSVIFDSFTQADASTTRRGGSGLGLAIASRLVAMMGGALRVESEVGRGSTFHFALDLPCSGGKPRALDQDIEKVLAGLPVLAVDDNATNRRILEHMLSHWRADVQSVDNGPSALRALEAAAASGRGFKLVLLDANMPEMNGFDLAKEIRSRPGLGKPSMMMLSSDDAPGELSRCNELGIAVHITKPFSRSELRGAILRVIEAAALRAAPSADASRPADAAGTSARSLRVLLAENNALNKRFAQALLEQQGHSVTLVANGREALDALELQSFDLLLLDLQMSEIDGYEVTSRIREAEAKTGRHVPIVAFTTPAMAGDSEKLTLAGIDAHVTKPIRRPELFDAIETALASAARASAAMDSEVAAASLGPSFDVDELMDRFDGNVEFVAEMVSVLKADTGQHLEQLRLATQTQERAKLARVAHSLKGSLATMASKPALEIANAVEEAAGQGSMKEIALLMGSLEREIQRLIQALEEFANRRAAA